jgi:hypothetical protein
MGESKWTQRALGPTPAKPPRHENGLIRVLFRAGTIWSIGLRLVIIRDD